MSTENALSRLVGQVSNNLALVDSGGGSFESLFPLVTQGAEAKMFDSEGCEVLAGKKAVRGIYLSHRFSCVVYPDAYNQGLGPDAQPDPIGGGAASFDNPYAKLIKDAAAAVQFTKAVERSAKFNFDATGAGLPRPSIEILIYNADVSGPVVLRAYSHYNAVYGKGRTLDRLLAQKNDEGQINPVPLAFKATVSEGYGKPLAWIDTEPVVDEAYADFLDRLQELGSDEDTAAAIDKWVQALDNPLDDRTIAMLNAARNINPPRR